MYYHFIDHPCPYSQLQPVFPKGTRMENDRLEEHKSLIHELNKGKELAKDLAKQLRETSSSSSSERLVENILASYSEALWILRGRDTHGQCQTVISSSSDPPGSSISLCDATQSKDSSSGSLERKSWEDVQNLKIMKVAPDEEQSLISSSSDPPGSSISLCNVTQSNDSSSGSLERKSWEDVQTVKIIKVAPDEDQSLISSSSDPPGSSISVCKVTQSKDTSSGLLKRKSRQDIQTVKIIGEAVEDGYCWRKYGQKDILGSKYPRHYFRCPHRHSQDCLATKQVQRSHDDPTIAEVTYWGVHTCQATDLASKLAS